MRSFKRTEIKLINNNALETNKNVYNITIYFNSNY